MCYTYKWRRLLVKETLIPPLQCWRIATALLFSVVIISIAHQCGKVKADEKFSFGVISAWLFFVHIFKMRPRSTAAAMGHIVYYAEKIIFLIWIHIIKPFGYVQRGNNIKQADKLHIKHVYYLANLTNFKKIEIFFLNPVTIFVICRLV